MATRVKTRKVVIIGAGHVGAHIALCLMFQHLVNEIVFLDINDAAVRAQVMDLDDLAAGMGDSFIISGGTYADCEDAHFVVNTAGRSRKPGESRLAMLEGTVKVLQNIVTPIKDSGFHGIFINVSNPCDIVTEYVYQQLGLPRGQVFGTGTGLDSARLRRILSDNLGVARTQVQAFCMGEHGDSSFIPASHITVGGLALKEYLRLRPEFKANLDLDKVIKEVRAAGGTIVQGKGCTEFGIAGVVADIIVAVLHDEKRVMPLSVHLDGEYGGRHLCAGTPCVLGNQGVEQVLELELSGNEQELMQKSLDVLRDYLKKIDL